MQPELGADRIAALEGIPGWTWVVFDARWEKGYSRLLLFAGREGHARVHRDHVEAGFLLGAWVATQRTSRRNLTADRIERLEAVQGWVWSVRDADWEEGYDRLTAYVLHERRIPLAIYTQDDGYRLGLWVATQRRRYRQRKVSAARIARLEALPGWTWDTAWTRT